MRTEWDAAVVRLQRRWGARLDLGSIAEQFIPFFHGPRIRVDVGGHEVTGRVGLTTGWKPALLLMRRADSIGSEWVLDFTNTLTGVQIGGRYLPPGDARVVSMFAAYRAQRWTLR